MIVLVPPIDCSAVYQRSQDTSRLCDYTGTGYNMLKVNRIMRTLSMPQDKEKRHESIEVSRRE